MVCRAVGPSRRGRARSRRRRRVVAACVCRANESVFTYYFIYIFIHFVRSTAWLPRLHLSLLHRMRSFWPQCCVLGCDWIQSVQWPFQVERDAYLAHLLICGAYAFSWCYNLFANVCRSLGLPLAASHGMRAMRTACISIKWNTKM